jgi:hypothetical protein
MDLSKGVWEGAFVVAINVDFSHDNIIVVVDAVDNIDNC